MSIRKRLWKSRKDGTTKQAWVVDYFDQSRKRRLKTFTHKRKAEQFEADTRIQISKGIHVPASASVTVTAAGELWLSKARDDDLERTTVEQYKQHLRLHIEPFIGAEKLSAVTIPFVTAFRDRLRAGDETLPDHDPRGKARSAAMVRGVIGSLGAILADAQERGLVVYNAVRERGRVSRRRGTAQQDRHIGNLEIGEDIPTPEEVRLLLEQTRDSKRWRPLFMTAVFAGLRASELRGLRWVDVDLKKGELQVRQRADRYNKIGPPKSAAGKRTIPLPPTVLNELREWKLVCPKKEGQLSLVFPNGSGNVENGANIVKRGLIPSMVAAGITKPLLDERGTPKRGEDGRLIVKAKYTGMHCLRHFFASWCINSKEHGGLELPPKDVQVRLGHSSIVMTMDVYGHLFPRGDDKAKLAAAEKALIG